MQLKKLTITLLLAIATDVDPASICVAYRKMSDFASFNRCSAINGKDEAREKGVGSHETELVIYDHLY